MSISVGDERVLEFSRFMKWINENGEMWDKVIGAFGDETALNDETYVKLFQQLKDNQFYQIIFILFQATDNSYLKRANKMAAMKLLSNQINKGVLDNYVDIVTDYYIRGKSKKSRDS